MSNQSPRELVETAQDAALLKRYKVLHLVGTGNYARVYKVLSANGKELAVKAINMSKTSDNYRQKFLPRELTILRKIAHPNIVKTYEITQISDHVFVVMQYCVNGTVADLLHRVGPLTEPVARAIFVPLMEAINYLHSLDLAHRDLKVENVLLDAEFSPKLTDFSYSIYVTDKQTFKRNIEQRSQHNLLAAMGIPMTSHQHQQQQLQTQRFQQLKESRITIGASGASNTTTPENTKTGAGNAPSSPAARFTSTSVKLNETFCGTVPYLPPELLRQIAYDARKSDIWSVGVCLYVMLNDRLPFPFTDTKQMVKKQLSRDFKFRSSIEFSSEVRDLVATMLEPDFVRRPSSFDVMRHPWMVGPREKPPLG